MFPFGADTVKTISPFLSVVPLTSIVVAPSIASAVIVSPLTLREPTSSIVTSAAVELVAETDESEEPSLTSTSTDRL